jgi:hypothetical protein
MQPSSKGSYWKTFDPDTDPDPNMGELEVGIAIGIGIDRFERTHRPPRRWIGQ